MRQINKRKYPNIIIYVCMGTPHPGRLRDLTYKRCSKTKVKCGIWHPEPRSEVICFGASEERRVICRTIRRADVQ